MQKCRQATASVWSLLKVEKKRQLVETRWQMIALEALKGSFPGVAVWRLCSFLISSILSHALCNYSITVSLRWPSAESHIPSTGKSTLLFPLLGLSCRALPCAEQAQLCWPVSLQALAHQHDCRGNSAWGVIQEVPVHRAPAWPNQTDHQPQLLCMCPT